MSLGPARWTLLLFLRLLPKNLMSRIAGLFACVRWPGPLQRLQIRSFAWTFGVNLDEVRDPLSSFDCVQSFFVRRLVEGARPIDPAPEAFVSPCDGAWGSSGIVEEGQLLQVKGRPYSLAELLGSAEEAERFEGGAFCTLYLSPRDYHRFHSPCDARVVRARYLPGTLWPVNKAGVYGVQGLFAQNERIVALFEVGVGLLAYIPVGATMVGKVHLTFDDLTTNVGGGRRDRTYETPHVLAKGDEVGRFEFGSTLVLVATPGLLALSAEEPGTPVVLGRRIGTLHSPAGPAGGGAGPSSG